MAKLCLWDSETNGLLKETTKVHCLGAKVDGVWYLSIPADYIPPAPHAQETPEDFYWPGFGVVQDVTLPNGVVLKDVHFVTNEELTSIIETADTRVAHNGNDFDDRVMAKLFKWNPTGNGIDTLLWSRLLYPTIYKNGPNGHLVPGQMKMRHSVEAWGYRLGEKKDKGFDSTGGGRWEAWTTWTWGMLLYMAQDIVVLEKIFKFLMAQKPSPDASLVEHEFATVIRRQESWGFTIDREKALTLQAKLQQKYATLEAALTDHFGEWWAPGKERTNKATRQLKHPTWPDGTPCPDVTIPRFSATTGKELKPYVGPPLATYEEGATWTPIEWTTFSPASRDHVRLKLQQMYGWKPTRFTKTGQPQVDDDVLRALPWPEAHMLADFYEVLKILGYVSQGKNAWISLAHEEEDGDWRMHGRVTTIGAGSFRASHDKPNMAQIPTRGQYGHECRSLFIPRDGFWQVGYDGSGMQLRLMAHHMARFDGGEYAAQFARGFDPHVFMRDTVGTDIMGEGDKGREHGKTTNYALLFGGGDEKLGSIVMPTGTKSQKIAAGRAIRERLADRFGGFAELTNLLKATVEDQGYLVGLDRRRCPVAKPHTALAFLLQMGEAIVMRTAKVILDQGLQREGLRPGIGPDGYLRPLNEVDYEFNADVHDEGQADVREHALDLYTDHALTCVRDAGVKLGVKCVLKSDVKVGRSWAETH